jgi:hypothetical protein
VIDSQLTYGRPFIWHATPTRAASCRTWCSTTA